MDKTFLIKLAFEEAKCNPRRYSCFYRSEDNEIVRDLSRKLFVESLSGKRIRIIRKQEVNEVVKTKVQRFRSNCAVESGSPLLSTEIAGETLLREIDHNIKGVERRALILWILRKVLSLPKGCPKCGTNVNYEHAQSCLALPIDLKNTEGAWKQASYLLQQALRQLS